MSTDSGEKRSRPPSTKAEIITTIAAIIGIPAAIITVWLGWTSLSQPPSGQNVTGALETRIEAPPSSANPNTSAGNYVDPDPVVPEPSVTEPEPVSPAEPQVQGAPLQPDNPPQRGPVVPLPPPQSAPPIRRTPSLEEQAAFIVGDWRLSDETCAYRQRFSIRGDVLSVSADGDILNSYRIVRVEGGGAVIVGSGARFILNGGRLSYVEGNRTVRAYDTCG